MKSFKQHLNEDLTWRDSASNYIFHDELHIPLTAKMLKRALNTKLPRVRVFHVSNPYFVDDMIKLQGKKKSLSALTRVDNVTVTQGINATGGMVFELEADVMVSAPNDIMSRPDKTGRRWLEWSYLKPNSQDKGMKLEIEKYGLSLKRDLIMKYVPSGSLNPFLRTGRIPLSKVHHYWRKLDPRNQKSPIFKELMSKQGRKKSGDVNRAGAIKQTNEILGNMVKDYINAMEKMIAKYPKEFAIMFFAHSQNKIKNVEYGWDELVVNNYKIKKVLFHDLTIKTGYASMSRENPQDVEYDFLIKKLNGLGIDTEVFQNAKQISREVAVRSNVSLMK